MARWPKEPPRIFKIFFFIKKKLEAIWKVLDTIGQIKNKNGTLGGINYKN
jgi:hypothetical protein